MAMLNPCHSGEILRDNLEAAELSVTNAAARLGCTRQALSRLLNGPATTSCCTGGGGASSNAPKGKRRIRTLSRNPALFLPRKCPGGQGWNLHPPIPSDSA